MAFDSLEELAGFCFDTGHAAITSEGDPLELAVRYQDRLYMMHVHDNHGLRSENCWEDGKDMARCDEHLNPYLGIQDWDRYAKIVAESPYELPIVIEVSKRDRDAAEFFKESIEMGEKLTAAITEIFGEVLGLAADHIYVKYEAVGNWGWNGANF